MSKYFSIITINYNDNIGLEKTIQSVINQTATNYEFIIIDGGSVDGSLEVIEIYKDQITYFVSEKDSGVFNAMNKGIKVAKGESYGSVVPSALTEIKYFVLAARLAIARPW